MQDIAYLIRVLLSDRNLKQRDVAKKLNISLGKCNQLFKKATSLGYLLKEGSIYCITPKGKQYMNQYKVDNALILAAGFGSRFVPYTYEIPKGLIPVNGTPMIERQIQQLHEVGILDISIVVGYLKEKFDYLIDKYDVKLIVNPEYSYKNNLSSLYVAKHILANTYVLSSDHWIVNNVFNKYEIDSWYSSVYKNGETSEWCIKMDKHARILKTEIGGSDSWVMFGPVYFSNIFSKQLVPLLEEYYIKPGTENWYWENILELHYKDLPIYINKQDSANIFEFESVDDLKAFDGNAFQDIENTLINVISKELSVNPNEIEHIECMKSGMTNKSFIFHVNDKKYVYRHPGEGTESLISRHNEKKSYYEAKSLGIAEDVEYYGDDGTKISLFYQKSHTTDPFNKKDLIDSFEIIKNLHNSGIVVEHEFDLKQEMEKYIKLCEEIDALKYPDYKDVYAKMLDITDYHDALNIKKVFCHVDCNPDNILRLSDGSIRIIDWEYAGMADPIIDVAMYSIYSYYSRADALELLDIYLGHNPKKMEEFRLYSIMARGGFLWAIWTEFKQAKGMHFGDYGLKMYRYAKEFGAYAMELIDKEKEIKLQNE